LPPHSLGDFGAINWGGVPAFFIRGAESVDREKLIRLGQENGTTLWHSQEELNESQMRGAEDEFLRLKPQIVLSHDAPTDIARLIWKYANQFRYPIPGAVFRPSRTNHFLAKLHDRHQPRIWVFGHHHRDWKYQDAETLFVCLGELSYIDIDQTGQIVGP
jgi:Icc-related predicted phosphoesterase